MSQVESFQITLGWTFGLQMEMFALSELTYWHRFNPCWLPVSNTEHSSNTVTYERHLVPHKTKIVITLNKHVMLRNTSNNATKKHAVKTCNKN